MEPELHAGTGGISLQEYLQILHRRRAILLQVFVLISVVGVVITLISRPVYQASAKLLVDGPSYNLNTVDSNNPLADILPLGQQQTVETQVEVLQTQPLLDEVSKLAGPANLTVATIKDTNVIEVSAEAGDAKIAAAAPNLLLQLYVNQDADQDYHDLETARLFVQKQGAQASRRLNASEAALLAFKQKHHVIELDKNRDDQIVRVSELTNLRQTQATEMAAERAQITATRTLLAREPATLAVTLQTTNALRADLAEQIGKLEMQRVSITQVGGFGPQAPQVIAMDAQIAELKHQRAAMPVLTSSETSAPNAIREGLRGKIVDLEAQAAAEQAQFNATTQALATATAQIGNFASWEVALARMNREHDAAEADDKVFTDKFADLTLREKARHATARIIESAQVPSGPVRPKKLNSIIFSCLIGLFVGICLALLAEFWDDRINSEEDASRVLSLPSLGYVPALSDTDAHLLPQMKSADPATESYRILRTNIHFASIDSPLRTLLVTSSNPGEGKTTTAANLAFAMAMDGKKVVLVDTDLRRPTLHKLLNLAALPGLTDVLLGHAALNPHEIMPGLSVLTAGSTAPNPSELLNSRTFRNLVDHLTKQADIIIFDSPPVLVAADAAILASQMDGTIMVIETGSTKKASAKHTLQLLKQARATILGVAYNKMRAQDSAVSYYYHHYGAAPEVEGPSVRPRTLLPANVDLENYPLESANVPSGENHE